MILRNVTRRGRVFRCLAAAGLVAGVATAGALVVPGAATASERFASAADATIHPGVMVESKAGQCTANFVFSSAGKSYLGAAAHCAGKGEATQTDGCKSDSYPLGTEFTIKGADHPGHLAYSSWLTMQKRGDKNQDLCAYNDFALIELDQDDVAKTNPSVPHFGGPTGVRTEGLSAGDRVYSYGNSALRQGVTVLSPKEGVSLGDAGGGRTHTVTTLSPGIPGDSGSGFLDSDGRAFGVLSTLSLTPIPGSNGVSDLHLVLDYAHDTVNDLKDLKLVNGTEEFHSGGLPLL
ncbi:MAG: S1 family peptidase [Actinomycetota bacterium]|nr:S1 family peptidase [Actinomycetota bacterium]